MCFWEDDGQDEHDANHVSGGTELNSKPHRGSKNFIAYGACEELFIGKVQLPLLGNVKSVSGCAALLGLRLVACLHAKRPRLIR